MFVVPILYRKSLSWNTLRARKRAEDKDAFSVGVKGQENGLLRKPKEITPPTPFASSDPVVKGKVSKAGRRCALVMLCVCQNPSPPPPHSVYVLCPNLSMCACVQTPVDTHTGGCVSVGLQEWFSTCMTHEFRLIGFISWITSVLRDHDFSIKNPYWLQLMALQSSTITAIDKISSIALWERLTGIFCGIFGTNDWLRIQSKDQEWHTVKDFLGVVTGYAGSQTYITGKLSVICSIEEL